MKSEKLFTGWPRTASPGLSLRRRSNKQWEAELKRHRDVPQGACFSIGYRNASLPPSLGYKSKPVVQHNPQPKPLNPMVIVNQALPIAIVILEKALDRIPQRKAVPKLH